MVNIVMIGQAVMEAALNNYQREVDFLYDKILDEKEMGSYSSFVKLGEQLSPDVCGEYGRYLTFQSMDNAQDIYSYESDAPNITIEQAMALCAELLRQEDPELALEEVMADDRWGYVGYKFNYRKMGEQILENKIGTRGDIFFDGMQLELYMYEDIIDNLESGEGHTATTATFHLFLKDKIIIVE